MDVSQINKSDTNPFAWDPTYASRETEDFARILTEQEETPDPVHETTTDRHDDDYNKDDDLRADDTNTTDDDQTAETDEKDVPSEAGQTVAAQETSLLPDTKTDVTFSDSTAKDNNTPDNIQSASANNVAKDIKAGTAQVTSSDIGVKPETATQASTAVQQTSNSTPAKTVQAATNTATETIAAQQASQATAAAANTAKKEQTGKTGQENRQGVNQQSVSTTSKPDTVSVKPVETDAIKQNTQPTTLETLRAEEMAKLSEKDALSTKIGEMLNMSKGKIALVQKASATTASNNGSLVSSATAMAASTASNQVSAGTATAIDRVTQAAQQAETPISLQSPTGSPVPVIQQAVTDPSVSGNSSLQGASVPGVEASSSNSNSQAANSAKASTQAGSPAEQVSKQITSAVREGADKIKIQLNPAELGRVDIKLELGHDGRILAVIAADNQESLDLLQQDSKTLEKALQDAGFETSDDSLNFSLSQHGQEEEEFQKASGDSSSDKETETTGDEVAADIDPAYLSSSASEGGLDIAV